RLPAGAQPGCAFEQLLSPSTAFEQLLGAAASLRSASHAGGGPSQRSDPDASPYRLRRRAPRDANHSTRRPHARATPMAHRRPPERPPPMGSFSPSRGRTGRGVIDWSLVTAPRARIAVVGSINVDLVVRTPRRPAGGETLAGTSFDLFPGGKGANQAV